MKKTPKPKINDRVEMIDFSKTCGNVIEIVSDTEIKIDWGGKFSVEKIRDVALIGRD